MSLSIKTKFTLISGLAILAVAYAAVQNYVSLQSMIGDAQRA